MRRRRVFCLRKTLYLEDNMAMDEGEKMKDMTDSNEIANQSKTKRKRIVSIILGVFSIIVPIGIVGICVGNSEKRKTGRTLGRDLSILGTVIGTALLCAMGFFLYFEFIATDVCEGRNFVLVYSQLEWRKEESAPDTEALISRDNSVYFNLDFNAFEDRSMNIYNHQEAKELSFSTENDRQDNYDLFLVSYFNFLGKERILESASDLMPVEGNSDLYYAYVDLTEEADGKRNGTLQYFLLSVSEETFWTFQVSLYDTEKSITEVDALVEDVLSTMTIKAE